MLKRPKTVPVHKIHVERTRRTVKANKILECDGLDLKVMRTYYKIRMSGAVKVTKLIRDKMGPGF